MIIDVDGNIVFGQMWWDDQGPLIKDYESPYKDMDFSIGVPFNDEQKKLFLEICKYKKYLNSTDYKALKYADGAISEEEYAPIREQRAQWRSEINRIEESFHPPTITREEMNEAERKAMEKIEELKREELSIYG